jgi:hypothetical protein
MQCLDNCDMPITLPTRVPDAAEVAALGAQQTAELLNGYAQTIDTLRHQVEWFKRQLFGRCPIDSCNRRRWMTR